MRSPTNPHVAGLEDGGLGVLVHSEDGPGVGKTCNKTERSFPGFVYSTLKELYEKLVDRETKHDLDEVY